jgi:hypothetical protein
MFGGKTSHGVVTICHGWFIAHGILDVHGANAQKYTGENRCWHLLFFLQLMCDIFKEI